MQGTKLIFTAELAKHLLKHGFTIVDIKPDKCNRDRTVFIFKWEESLNIAVNEFRDK